MSDPEWPLTLPQRPLRDGYSFTPGQRVIESQMSSGPSKSRPRFTAVEEGRAVSYTMTADQAAVFRDFVKVSLAGGALPFLWPDPEGGYAPARVRIPKGDYTKVPRGAVHWTITFKLLVLP